jgi:hypothetical protein
VRILVGETQFYLLYRRQPDLGRFMTLGDQTPGDAVVGLARGIATSPLWSQVPGAELVVRESPPAIAAIGSFDGAGIARLEALARQVSFALRTLRYISYSSAEEDCRILAEKLLAMYTHDELKNYRFTAIPRGGLLVLSMLAYILGLERRQLEPSPAAELPVIVVDDCAVSGVRIGQFLEHNKDCTVIFAPLYSPPALRAAVISAEERVAACISARDLQEDGNGEETSRPEWKSRFISGRYWVGRPEYLCFAWNEPDRLFWNRITEKVESGWNLLPPELCLKNGPLRIPVHIQPEGCGCLRVSQDVMYVMHDDHVLIGNLESGITFRLEGVAAAIWKAALSSGQPEQMADAVRKDYNTGEGEIKKDISRFVGQLIDEGILERTDGPCTG